MVPQEILLVAIALSAIVSACVTLFIGRLYVLGKQDHICDHLKITWNVLAGYRRAMPDEVQPLDAAMGHLQMALMELGARMPQGAAHQPVPPPFVTPTDTPTN